MKTRKPATKRVRTEPVRTWDDLLKIARSVGPVEIGRVAVRKGG